MHVSFLVSPLDIFQFNFIPGFVPFISSCSSPHPSPSLSSQHIYSVVLRSVSEARAGVLLCQEFDTHIDEIGPQCKEIMSITVFISGALPQEGGGGEWLQL